MPRTATASTNRWTRGKTWKQRRARRTAIRSARVRVHPKNPDIVYVAALGHVWGPNEMRGVFRIDGRRRDLEAGLHARPRRGRGRSRDGSRPTRACSTRLLGGAAASPGASTAAGRAAASSNPPTAATPGPTSRARPACRKGVLGRIGVTVSPANPERVWAIVEAEDGGVFRSDNARQELDAGQRAEHPAPARLVLLAHLRRPEERRHGLRAERRLLQIDRRRPHVHRIRPPHGDNHDLWIAPDDPQRMIESNDGGANDHATTAGARGPRIDEPADRAVLSRRARQRFPVPHLRRAAGQLHRAHRQPHRRRRHHGARLVRRRRRRERLDRARSAQFADRLRRLLRRPDHAPGPSHRPEPQHQRLARQSDGLRRGGDEVSLPVELPDRVFAARSEDALHRRATCCSRPPTKARAGR